LLRVCLNAVRCPLMCGHLWSLCTTPLSVSCSWHRPRKPVESWEWFPLGYHQAFGKIWCNIAAHVVPSFYTLLESVERSLDVLTHRPTASDCRFLRAGKNSQLRKNVPSTSPPKEASRASLVYAGKNKVRYFLNTPRM
jgi:hypothetical protein